MSFELESESWPVIDLATISTSPPQRRIKTEEDMSTFKESKAYHTITAYIRRLRLSVVSQSLAKNACEVAEVDSMPEKLVHMLASVEDLIRSNPPVPTPQRFGNIAFRSFHKNLREKICCILDPVLENASQKAQLEPLLIDSFGNDVRIDYGSGHELSFMCFLASLHCAGLTTERDLPFIVNCVFRRYWLLIGSLQDTFKLEPAGSHGVWGLDDYSFLPYYFGSAQLQGNATVTPEMILSPDTFQGTQETENLYIMAIRRILSQKSGPFHEHSPQLHSIATNVNGGWNKINQGLWNMYVAEVLGKRVVVQHLWFNNYLSWSPKSSINFSIPVNKESSAERAVKMPLSCSRQKLNTIDVRGLRFSKPRQCIELPHKSMKFRDTRAYSILTRYLNNLRCAVQGCSTRTKAGILEQDTGPFRLLQVLSQVSKLAIQNSPHRTGQSSEVAYLNFQQFLKDDLKSILTSLVHDADLREQFLPMLSCSFGSDRFQIYGSVHEVSFISFLTCLRLVGALSEQDDEITVTHVFTCYYQLIGTIQTLYGIAAAEFPQTWSIDSWSHLSYFFGTAQLEGNCPVSVPSWAASSVPSVMPTLACEANLFALSLDRLRNRHLEISDRLKNILCASQSKGWGEVNRNLGDLYMKEVLNDGAMKDLFFNDFLPWESCETEIAAEVEADVTETPAELTKAPWSVSSLKSLRNFDHMLPPPLKSRNGRHTLASTGSASAMTSPFGSLPLPRFNTQPVQKLRDVYSSAQ